MSVRHISGLWRGEAAPAPALADSVPANPILWSLTLLHPAAVSCFGCGYFDDAGDVPGEAILFYMLRGEWAPDTGALSLLKSYTSANLLGVAPHVRYEGRLARLEDGAWGITGTWRNEEEGTHGVFACRKEEELAEPEPPGDAAGASAAPKAPSS